MKFIFAAALLALVGSSLAAPDCKLHTVKRGETARYIAAHKCDLKYREFAGYNRHIRDLRNIRSGQQVCCSDPTRTARTSAFVPTRYGGRVSRSIIYYTSKGAEYVDDPADEEEDAYNY